MTELFRLDEAAATESDFAARYPVEDDHSAMLAIDQATNGDDDDICITGPDGWTMYVDLTADGDGKLDGYRILVQQDGASFYLAAYTDSVGWQENPPTLDVLRDAAATASHLITSYQEARS